MAIDPKKVSKEEMARALELLEKEQIRKERIAKGEIKGSKKWSEMTEEEKAKQKLADAKRNARIKILLEKAEAAGLTASDAEIDKWLKAKGKV